MTLPVPINRTELYLAKIAGEDVTIPAEPINNTEVFLARLAGADIVLPTPINTLQVWLAILCGELYTMPPVQGAELIGVQMVRTEFLAASAGLDGVTTPTPENRAEEYWAKIAEEMAVQTITVKGTSLHLLHVVSGIEDFQYVYGDTEQTKYSGKNLLNPDAYETDTVIYNPAVGFTFTNTFKTGITCQYDSNKIEISSASQHGGGAFMSQELSAGTYYFSATVVAGSENNARVSYSILDASKTVIEMGQYGTTQTGASRVYGWEINVPSSGVYIVVSVVTSTSGGGNITINNPQIEKNSTATSYEPYVGGTASPNPDYPQDVHVVTGSQVVNMHGKNLFKIQDTEETKNDIKFTPHPDGTFDLVGTASANTEFYTIVPLAQSGIEGGATYKPSTNGPISISSLRYYVHSCTENGGWVKMLLDISRTTALTAADPTTEYIKFVIRVNNGNVVNLRNVKFQLERGDIETAFEPYQGGGYPLTLGSLELCKIGDYQDYIYKSGDDWYVHKEVSKYTFTGSESWVTDPYGTNSWRVSAMIIVYEPDTSKTMVICDAALGVPYDKRTSYDSPRTCICYYNVSSNRFWIRNTACDTLEKIQTATTGKNVYYKVAPTDTKITDATLVSQLNALDSAILPTPEAFVTVSGNLPAPIQFTYQGKL